MMSRVSRTVSGQDAARRFNGVRWFVKPQNVRRVSEARRHA